MAGDVQVGDADHASKLTVTDAAKLDVDSTGGGMKVFGDALIDKANTIATIDVKDTAAVGGNLDVKDGAKLTVTTKENGTGGMTVTGNATVTDANTVATINVAGDVQVGDADHASKLTVTKTAKLDVDSSNGGMKVFGDALIDKANTLATIYVKDTAAVDGTLDVLDGAKLTVTTNAGGEGGMEVGGNTTINEATAIITVYNDTKVGGTLDVLNGSELTVTTKENGTGGMTVTGNATVSDANTVATINVAGDVQVGDADHASKLTVTKTAKLDVDSSNGGMKVFGDALIDKANTLATIYVKDTAAVDGTLDVLDGAKLTVTTNAGGEGGMEVGGNTTINEATAIITVYNDTKVGGTLDVLDNATLTVQNIANGIGGMAVTGETNLKNHSTATITVYGDATVGDSTHESDLNVDTSTLALTSTNGGMGVFGAALIDNASTATINLAGTGENHNGDAAFGSTLDVLNASTLTLNGKAGMTVGGDTTVKGLSEATITLDGSAAFDEDIDIDTSKMTLTAGKDVVATGLATVHGDDGAVLTVDAGDNVRFVDRDDSHGGLTADKGHAELLARKGNMTVDHVKADDAVVKLTSNGGDFRAKTVDLNRASVAIDALKDVRIVSDENDVITDPSTFEDFYPVINVYDSSDEDSVTVRDPLAGTTTTEARGLNIHSTDGAMDSTDGGYRVLYNANAAGDKTIYEKDGKYYHFVFGAVKGNDRFEPIDAPADLADYTDKGVFNLYAYNYAATPAYYDEGQRVYLEQENTFYYMDENGEIQRYGTLADKVKDDRGNAADVGNTKLYELRDIGVPNYYDGWYVDRSTLNVSVSGDVDIQDTVRMLESVATIISRNGALTVADYFMDLDGDGIGDEMETTEWDLRNSVANTLIDKNIRIDHLSLQVSVMDMNVERDAITSKTWYMVGSKLTATAETAVQVINADDKYFTPAVIAFWSNDDLYLIRADSGDEPVYEPLGLHVKVRNGDAIFMTRKGESDDANTTDFFATASTVDIDVRDRVIMLETMVNVDSASNNGGLTTFTAPKGYDLQGNDPDTVTDENIFKLKNGVYTAMLDANFTQSERAYGSEINLKSSGEVDMTHAAADNQTPNSHVSAANWTVEGATLKDGTLNAGIGQSDVNITALGDVSFLYNLNHLPQSRRIAERELTLTEGSHATLTSTEGAVDLLYDYDSAADANSTLAYTKGDYVGDNGADLATAKNDVVIAGDKASGQRSTLEILSYDALKVASVNAEFADANLRSTNSDVLFDRIDGSQTNLRVMAEGNIDALHPQHSAMIRFDDKDNRDDENRDEPGNASVTLNAQGDIGTANRPLLVDIPEALTLTVEKVTNLNIDARKRDASGAYNPPTSDHSVDGGIAADGSNKTGDYLNYSSEQFFNVGISDLDSQKLASWLLARSKTVFKDGATPGWTNMVKPDIDLTAYIRAMAGTAAPTDATLEELIALVGEEAILNQLLADDAIVYNYTDANGQVAQGSLQDLINYLINNDGSYADGLEQTLLNAAVAASAEYAKDMQRQLAEANAAKRSADAAVQSNLDKRDAAEEAIWQLYSQRAYDLLKLNQLQAEHQALVDSGASDKKIKAAKKAVEEQQKLIDQADADIAEQQALVDAANAAIAEAKAQAETAKATVASLQPEAARTNDHYANYTDLGGAETATATWQTSTEATVNTLGGDIDATKALTGTAAEGALEATLAKLNTGIRTLRSADAYSEASLARAIELSTDLKGLADELTAAAGTYLNTANALYNEAQTNYKTKLDAQAAAQLAYDDAHTAAEAAQTQADADQKALDKELARSTPRADRVAALQAALDASNAQLAAARDAESAALANLNAAKADSQAAKAVAEERQQGIARTEAVIAGAKDAGLNANGLGHELSNTYIDVDARRFNLAIGQMNEGGALNLYNEGDINAVVDSATRTPDYVALADSDVTVNDVTSRRGDVSITNRSGSILAGDNDGAENVHASAITLEARDSIGSADGSFVVEETSHTPTRVANPTLIDADRKTEFGNIVGIETATRYEDIALPTGSLYTEPTTLVPVVLVGADGKRVDAQMRAEDLRKVYALNGDMKVTFGVVDTQAQEQTGSAAIVEVRLDWMRVFDETEGTELNATAHNGDIYLTERTGDVGAGEIRAAGDVVLNATTGAVATANDRTTVEVGGEMTVNAKGDVNLVAEGDLTLNLNTEANHVEITTDDKTGAGDITVVSQSDKALTGSALSNGSVTLSNGGDIGTANGAFEVDTDAKHGGTVTLDGDNINVTQKDGTMLVNEIEADGDLNLNVGGDVIDTGANGMSDSVDRVVEAQQALTDAERALNDADREVYVLTSADQVNKAEQGLADATDNLAKAEAELERANTEAADANAALAQAKQNYKDAVAANGASSQAAIEALDAQNLAQANADAAAEAARQAAQNLEAARKALEEAQKDPYIVLKQALAAIEEAKANGASDEELSAMLDAAVNDYRTNSPNNGDHTDQIVLNQLLLDQAEAALKVAQNNEANAQAALEAAQATGNAKAIAKAEQALAAAQEAVAQKTQDVEDLRAALDKAIADTTAAKEALEAAQAARDRAEEALKIAEDALAAQADANAARDELSAAEDANDQKAADKAATKVAANDYLVNAQENLYDAYKEYDRLAGDPTADPEALAQAADAVAVARQAVAEAENAVKLANDSDADRALVDELMDRLDKAVEAERTLAENPDDENAKLNADKAHDALAAAKQAVDAAAERLDAQNAVNDAQTALNAANDRNAAADQALADATQAYEDALANAQALAESGASKTKQKKANEAAQAAYDAMKAAEAEKAAAQNAVTEAGKQLDDAEKALEAAKAKEAGATQLAQAAAQAADAKTAQDEAQQALADAQSASNEVNDLIDQLSEADKALAQAQKNYDEAYQDYLDSNTDIVAAKEGAEDTDARREALDKAAEALQGAKDDVQRIVDEIEAIVSDTGLAEAEEAMRDAQEKLDEANRRLDEANDVLAKQDTALADAEQALADANQKLEDARAAGATEDELKVLQAAKDEAEARRDELKAANENAKAAAEKAAADKTAADAAMDKAQSDLATAKANASGKADQAIADGIDAAQKALNDATNASNAAADKLNQAQTANGSIRNDATGTRAAAGANDKTGNAAIRTTGNANITSGGSVTGANGRSMTINTNGKLKVNAKNDLNMQSTKPVQVDSITAGGNVNITANGSITSVGGQPAITANKVTLNAISTRGRTTAVSAANGKPMVVDTNELGMRANNIDVQATGDVKLNDIVADVAKIQAEGNVTQTGGTQVDVGVLDLRAGGDIGSREAPIVMNVNEITAIGKNVYIKNKSRSLLVHMIRGREVWIDTDGDINTTPDGMIIAHDLIIRALGNIGTKDQPIRLKVSGKLNLESYLGRIWYKNFFKRPAGGRGDWRLLVDPETQISVYGKFVDGAWLEVTNTSHYAQLMYPEQTEGLVECECEKLTDYSEDCATANPDALAILAENSDSEACKQLWSLIGDGSTLYDFVLGVFAPTQPVCNSPMYFEIDFNELDSTYDGALEGETLYVMACVEGEMVCVQTVVEDGKIHLVLDRLGTEKADGGYTQFAIVDAATFEGLLADGSVSADSVIDANGQPVDFASTDALPQGAAQA